MYILYGVDDQGEVIFRFHPVGFVHASAHPVYIYILYYRVIIQVYNIMGWIMFGKTRFIRLKREQKQR